MGAEISIRKGKQILCFNFDSDVEWFCESSSGEAEGSFHISDINQAELDFEINQITVSNDREIGGKARTILKKVAKDELIQFIKPLNDELMAMENDEKKLAEAQKKKREENAILVAETREATGAEKEKLLM